jgi:hypothetical protein
MPKQQDDRWPVEIDVMPRFRPADNYAGRAITSMAVRIGGGGSGLLASIDFDQRVCLVVDGVVRGHTHQEKLSDKTTVFELVHTVRPDGIYVVEMDRGGLDLIAACQGAHAQQHSTHGGSLVGLEDQE